MNFKTSQELAQWVIDNRYPKSELDKVSDFEMYHILLDGINSLIKLNPNQEPKLKTHQKIIGTFKNRKS